VQDIAVDLAITVDLAAFVTTLGALRAAVAQAGGKSTDTTTPLARKAAADRPELSGGATPPPAATRGVTA